MPPPQPPELWPVADDWRKRAERIGARLRGSDDAIRAVAVAGDYPAGTAWPASLLHIVVFPHAEQPRLDQGGISDDNGIPYVVDRVTTGLLTELENVLTQEPLAGTLAGLTPLRIADPTLRDLLPAFRDRYHSAAGRQDRIRRALQHAKVSLDDYAAGGPPVLAVEALQNGIARATAAALGEPHDQLRLPRRLRAAARVLRIPDAAEHIAAAFQLAERNPTDLWTAVDNLETLARAHLDARLPEIGPALLPLIERTLEPARRASAILAGPSNTPAAERSNPPTAAERGDAPGAAWAALSAAAEMDSLIERAAPGWRDRDDYAPRAAAVYHSPNPDPLNTLRRHLQTHLT